MTDLFGNEPMRALWWKQPFGTMMLYGKIETRSWDTAYRGLVLICTTMHPYTPAKVHKISGARNVARMYAAASDDPTLSLNGFAIAVGELFDARPVKREEAYRTYVDYLAAQELYGHHYRDVRRIEPIPMKGCLGWRIVSDEIRNQIKFL